MGGEVDSGQGQGAEGASAAAPSTAAELYDVLALHLAAHDKPAFVRTAVEAVSSGAVGIAQLYREVLTPLLVQAGSAWQRGRLTVWEEHMASAMVRSVVEIVYLGALKARASGVPKGSPLARFSARTQMATRPDATGRRLPMSDDVSLRPAQARAG